MRNAIVSLVAFTGLATSALAQDAAAPPSAPTAPALAPAATPEAPAPAASPAPTTSAAPDASAPAPAAAEPPPTLPTTGDGAQVLSVLERICVPAVQGGQLDQLAQSAGMKKNRRTDTYVTALGQGRDYSISVLPPGSNPNVCQVELRYASEQSDPILKALNVWTILHQPELKPQRRDFTVDSENKRITTSWEYYTDRESIGLVFVELRKPDGSPLNAKFDTATLQYSERKF